VELGASWVLFSARSLAKNRLLVYQWKTQVACMYTVSYIVVIKNDKRLKVSSSVRLGTFSLFQIHLHHKNRTIPCSDMHVIYTISNKQNGSISPCVSSWSWSPTFVLSKPLLPRLLWGWNGWRRHCKSSRHSKHLCVCHSLRE
jgi:hypothetical protein